MNSNVFTYGSLMFDEVWRKVVAGRYRSQAATLLDHRRHAITGVSYPAIVSMPGERVAGLLYLDVSADDLARLDAFEGTEYRRDALPVVLENGETVSAWTYVWLDHGRLSDAQWLSEAFRLREFLETYAPGTGESGS
ncbi:MAG: gamma-glutamylcyclotransferase family protein [Noviherbaspirillum sp.]